MADLTITADDVLPGSNATIIKDKAAGENFTAGQPVYLNATTDKWMMADSNVVIATTEQIGIAVSTGRTSQLVAVQTAGTLDVGATLTKRTLYVVANGTGTGTITGEGLISPIADLIAGDYLYILGWASATDELTMRVINTGITDS
jgi:hypothetical protein